MIFYGINPVLESLRSNRKPKTVYLDRAKTDPAINRKKGNPNFPKIGRLAAHHNIPVKTVDRLEKLCDSRYHQGVAAEIDNPGVRLLKEITHDAQVYVIFDGLQDPQNFGAAIRVCEVFGFHDLVFHEGDSCGVTPTAIKASSGAFFHVNLYLSNLNSAIRQLSANGYQIVVLDSDGDQNLYGYQWPEKFALIIGSEGFGVRFAIKRLADAMVKIPLVGKVDSLNVSCALSATLSEICRQRTIVRP